MDSRREVSSSVRCSAPQRGGDAGPVPHAEELVHLRQFGPQLVGVTLRQAADHEQPLDASRPPRGRRPQDHIDGLLLGVADKAAGVDDHHAVVGAVAVEYDRVACGGELCRQVLRIDRVFGAAERDDVDFLHRPVSSLFFHFAVLAPNGRLMSNQISDSPSSSFRQSQ